MSLAQRWYLSILSNQERFLTFSIKFSDRMRSEASEYMLQDHNDNEDTFPGHLTYFAYSKGNFSKRLDYIID